MLRYFGYQQSSIRLPMLLWRLRCTLTFFLVPLLVCTGFAAAPSTAFANVGSDSAENETTVFDEPASEEALVGKSDEYSETETMGKDEKIEFSADSENVLGLTAHSTKLEPLAADTISVCTASQLRNAVKKAPKNTLYNIVLGADISLGKSTLAIPKGKNIVLLSSQRADNKPYLLKASGSAKNEAILVESGAKLTVIGIKLTCKKNDGIYNKGTFVMKRGKIVNCGGCGVVNRGIFTMQGGTIAKNRENGVYNGDTFTMVGGSISENKKEGVFNSEDFLLTGGTILRNKNGGVFNYGLFAMSDGVINNNTTKENGGGVYNGETFKMSGGCIVGNTSKAGKKNSGGNGGGVYNSGTFKMTGGSISKNKAAKDGGGIYTTSYKRLSVESSAKFSGNRAKKMYNRIPSLDKIYGEKIACTRWSKSLGQGYNNHDINHTGYTGLYTIKVVNKPLGIENSSTKAKAYVELQKTSYAATQRFYLNKVETKGSKDYYTITNVLSGKRLAVKGGKATKGAVVWQNKTSKSKAQRFLIKENPKGGYWISPKGSKLVFSLKGGKADVGTNIVLAKKSKSKTQCFELKVVRQSFDVGFYVLRNKASNSNLVPQGISQSPIEQLTAPPPGYPSSPSGYDASWLSFNYDEKTGYYFIKQARSGLVLGVDGDSTASKSSVSLQKADNKSFSQKWWFKKNSDKTFTIVNAQNGKALEFDGGASEGDSSLWVNNRNNTKAQKWTFGQILV